MKRVKETYGPAAILLRGGGGNLGFIHGGSTPMARLLSLFGGYTTAWGSNSWEGATFASAATLGTIHVENSRDDLLNSRFIILWGCDPAVTVHGTNTLWYLIQAKEKGVKIVSVDPRFTDGAAILADRWIPIRPTTDAAMLIAMAFVLVKENLQDQAFLDRYTVGFDRFKAYLLGEEDGIPKTPSWAEAITGAPASEIESPCPGVCHSPARCAHRRNFRGPHSDGRAVPSGRHHSGCNDGQHRPLRRKRGGPLPGKSAPLSSLSF